MRAFKKITLYVGFPVLVLACLLYTGVPTYAGSSAQLQIEPAEIFLSPALIKAPVTFKGSGFGPKEMVTVEMILPAGMKMKGVTEGEDVGIALADTDENGNFVAPMTPVATLNWFFQVGWTPLLKPDFKEAKPLPPGEYSIRATGLDSDITAVSVLKIVPPPPKKEEK